MFSKLFKKMNWSEVSERTDLSYKEIYKYRKVLDFTAICKNYPEMPLPMVHDLRKYIDWKTLLCYHETIPDVFIVMHEYKYINFAELSKEECIPYDILVRYAKFFDWSLVTKYRKFGTARAEKYYEYLDKQALLTFQRLDSKFIDAHWDDLKEFSCIVESCQTLSVSFMRKHADELDWHLLCSKQKLSSSFMDEMSDRFDGECWESISKKQNLTAKFIKKYEDKLDMETVVAREDLKVPEEITKKYIRR